jgi:hypothetical protein
LQGFWPRGMDVRPRASEMPFAGAYQTRLESLYPAASAPAALERLHAILPLELAAVEARARAAAAQERVTEALAQAYLQGQVDLTSITGALERLRRQRSQVVEGIIGYNRHIAEYALSVGAGQGDATVASMLIPRPEVPATQIITRGELQPVAAVETLQAVPGQTPANQAVIFRDPAPYATPLPSGSR